MNWFSTITARSRYLLVGMVAMALVFVAAGDLPAQVCVSEYLSANAGGIVDEDGDREDWIEIRNSGSETVNLLGYGLSDDNEEPLRWTFPEILLPAGRHVLVFASGKDRRDAISANCWEGLIDWGDIWRYRVNTDAPPPDWREPDFDDSDWPSGPTGIGCGDGDDRTEIPLTVSYCGRYAFHVGDIDKIATLALHVDYDDAFVAYINGVEVARANIGTPGDPPTWDQYADSSTEARLYRGLLPHGFAITNPAEVLQPGANLLAVEIHNAYGSADLSMVPFLSSGLYEIDANHAPTAEALEGALHHLHANFKLSSEGGEDLWICDPQGSPVAGVETTSLTSDISCGLYPDCGGDWLFYDEPSPSLPNAPGGSAAMAALPVIYPDGGFHTGPVSIGLTHEYPAAIIRYTLDGSVPGEGSLVYSEPFAIDTTAALRTRAWVPGQLPSSVATRGFMVGEETDLPVIFLTTDPPNLWDWETGIYVLGPNAEPDFPFDGANFYEPWEKPVHMDFYESNGASALRLDGGLKVHGGYTRAYDQKSLRVHARDAYGTDVMDYQVFPDKPYDQFESLILRNCGQDWRYAGMRDILAQHLSRDQDVGYSAGRGARVYLNGVYWGFHRLRERQDVNFLADNFGADPDNLDYLEGSINVIEGSYYHYYDLRDFLEQNDMNDSFYYDQLPQWMDILNFATYYAVEIYLDNNDWPSNNRRYWCSPVPEGIWRWLFWDLDWTFGFFVGPDNPTLLNVLDENGSWPCTPWTTMPFRELMESDAFRNLFINCLTEHINSTFSPTAIAEEMGVLAAEMDAEMARHRARWDLGTYETWEYRMQELRSWGEQRPAHVFGHCMEAFALTDTLRMTLGVSPAGSGKIGLACTEVAATHTQTRLLGVPLDLEAKPAYGWVFAGWSDTDLPMSPNVTIDPLGDSTLTAVFSPAATSLVINEINYNSHDDFDPGDWVELCNPGESGLDLEGFVLRDGDDGHAFVLPQDTWLPVGGYLVICRDLEDFQERFPDVNNAIGDMDFGLSGSGEAVRLFDPIGELVDIVIYDDSAPWPDAPDGDGPTLELVNPALDNELPESWAASSGHGTPGEINSTYEPVAAPDGNTPMAPLFARPWPNPFNPAVRLRLAMAEMGQMSLSIFDVRGRCVATLASSVYSAGVHEFVWRPGEMPSGVYLARMSTGGVTLTRKLVLLK